MHGAGARVAFGGKPLMGHSIPEVYGAIEPTAVFVPIEQLVKEEHFGACTTEVFGPLQVGAALFAPVFLLSLLQLYLHSLQCGILLTDIPAAL